MINPMFSLFSLNTMPETAEDRDLIAAIDEAIEPRASKLQTRRFGRPSRNALRSAASHQSISTLFDMRDMPYVADVPAARTGRRYGSITD